MAVGNAFLLTNDKDGQQDVKFSATVFATGSLSAASEGLVMLPAADNGWKLTDVVLSVGANTTHTDGEVTATVEKNTDGGTSVLTTDPSIDDSAGTGRKTTAEAATGIVVAAIDPDEAVFDSYEVAFVTLDDAGTTGGAVASDVAVVLEFTRQQDFDPAA